MIVGESDIESAFAWNAGEEKILAVGRRMIFRAKATPEADRFFRDNRTQCAASNVVFDEWPRGSGKWGYTWFRPLHGQVVKARQDARALSTATGVDVEIVAPPGLEYRHYQKAGIVFMRGRRGTLLGDEMGLGKTIQILGRMNDEPSIQRTLIVCPPGLVINWLRESRLWLVRRPEIGIADGQCFPSTDVVIIGYSMLAKWAQRIATTHWDLIALDEAHYLKTRTAARTKVIFGYRPKKKEKPELASAPVPCRFRIASTGSPIPNKTEEIWPILAWLDPVAYPHRDGFRFLTRYCGMKKQRFGWACEEPKPGSYAEREQAILLQELQIKLRETVLIRRLKKDVEKELPPKVRSLVVFPTPASVAQIERQALLFPAAKKPREDTVRISQATMDPDVYAAAVGMLGQKMSVGFEGLAEARRELGMAKVPFAIEQIVTSLEETRKIVVFAHHREVLEALHAGLKEYGALLSYGGMGPTEKQANVDRFQQNPHNRVHVCSIMAMAEGYTMTAATLVVFVEQDFRPGIMAQCEDRLHRIGQTETVMVHVYVFDGTYDARLVEVLITKGNNIRLVLDAAPEAKAERRMAPAPAFTPTVQRPRPPAVLPPPPKPAPVPVVTAAVFNGQPAPDADVVLARSMDEESIDLVHGHLKRFADDWGEEPTEGLRRSRIDRVDVMLAKEFAGLAMLSPLRAAQGLRMLTKHRKLVGEMALKSIYSRMAKQQK